ncbi:hypothetical protein AVEN_49705-1 [Araneus ventricosus]|uniref:Uncharacterized protein n=1 Tax=Araneus ventricosus TaxID=182803 RepID=A0A4Y2VHH0_ARAVE|nr:hypothetical protein AVEN_49705-1 [Araneus ventricosus]
MMRSALCIGCQHRPLPTKSQLLLSLNFNSRFSVLVFSHHVVSSSKSMLTVRGKGHLSCHRKNSNSFPSIIQFSLMSLNYYQSILLVSLSFSWPSNAKASSPEPLKSAITRRAIVHCYLELEHNATQQKSL